MTRKADDINLVEMEEANSGFKSGPTTEYEKALELGTRSDAVNNSADKILIRKIDIRLMPIMCITYALQYYDKALLGQAAIFGLRQDTHIDGTGLQYSNATMIFYIGYIVGCYPLSSLAQKYPTGKVCAILCLAWATVVMSTAACSSYAGIMINRVFLGFIESGIAPSFMLVTGMWYTREQQVVRSGIWYSFSGGSNIISPLINYGLGSIQGGTLHSWQYMYLVAGAVTAVWSIVIWFFMPDSPVNAKGFTEEEKARLIGRLRGNNQGAANPQFKIYQVKEALLSYQFWMVCILSCTISVTAGPVTAFSSIIINGFGFNIFVTLLLNIPIGAMAIICINGSTFLGRYIRNARLYLMATACIPVIIGCALVAKLPSSNQAGRLAGIYLLNFFSAAYVHCITIGTSNISGSSKKTVYAAAVFTSYCVGQIIGPLIFPGSDAPRYEAGFTGTMVCLAVAFTTALTLRLLLSRENKRRDEIYGEPGTERGLEDLTDKENTDFRYNL